MPHQSLSSMSSGNLYPNNDTIDISAKSEGTSRSHNKDHERNESVIIFLPFLISPVIGRLIDENNKIYQKHYFLLTLWFVL